jgi:hypothetical protein
MFRKRPPSLRHLGKEIDRHSSRQPITGANSTRGAARSSYSRFLIGIVFLLLVVGGVLLQNRRWPAIPTVKAISESLLHPSEPQNATSSKSSAILIPSSSMPTTNSNNVTLTSSASSSSATVIGMAWGYNISVFERFVGTLRKTGYSGHIILGLAPDVSQKVLDYLRYRQVIHKVLQLVNCSFADRRRRPTPANYELYTCVYPYDDIKIRWSRYPLAADWLRDCETCTGPVLITDVGDSYFQLDPFGPGSPPIVGLQVYEEYKTQTTLHWLTQKPIEVCKRIRLTDQPKPMLCSGTTTGTRDSMLRYLDLMYQEMKLWAHDPSAGSLSMDTTKPFSITCSIMQTRPTITVYRALQRPFPCYRGTV